jgi:hypothetical protein
MLNRHPQRTRSAAAQPDYQAGRTGEDFLDSMETAAAGVARSGRRRVSLRRRLILGLLAITGLFLLYRVVWLTAWAWPYSLICDYLREHLPLAGPWAIQSMALALCALLFAQAGAIASFVLFGRHKREMLILVVAGALVHAGLGWYGYERVAVDEEGRVKVRVVERPDGSLKVIDRNFDPETGRRARWATPGDLVMLDLQHRGVSVERVAPSGPFRSPQGTIIVYWAQRGDRIALFTGPRHRDVSGEMQLATEEILRMFIEQNQPKGKPRRSNR